jgi:hypothetical protein
MKKPRSVRARLGKKHESAAGQAATALRTTVPAGLTASEARWVKKESRRSRAIADVLRAKRTPDALFGEGRRVHGVVEEPGAMVVPQVMVGILRANADTGQGGFGGHDA